MIVYFSVYTLYFNKMLLLLLPLLWLCVRACARQCFKAMMSMPSGPVAPGPKIPPRCFSPGNGLQFFSCPEATAVQFAPH